MSSNYQSVNKLKVSENLLSFVNEELLDGIDISPKEFWYGFDKIVHELSPKNVELIRTRENLQNTQSHQKGGLSGKPIETKSTELIRKFYKVLKGRIKIIGVGGVDSGRSAYQKLLAGADYLQLYTGMVFRGPNIVGLIKKELKEILLKDGVKNFSEIVGKKRIN